MQRCLHDNARDEIERMFGRTMPKPKTAARTRRRGPSIGKSSAGSSSQIPTQRDARWGEGHQKGYDWAESNGVTTADDCPYGNSNSFHEGCLRYAAEQQKQAQEAQALQGGK